MLVSVEAVLIVAALIFSVGAETYNLLAVQGTVMAEEAGVILQQGTAGSSIIYADSTSAKVTVAPSSTRFYYPGGYNIAVGSHVSGSVPASVRTVDSDYFIVGSAVSSTSTLQHYPSGYSLLGSTTRVSGSLADLTSNDGAYMTFRSYSTVTNNLEDYVDQQSNVDGSADKGTHSNFTALQACDGIYDTLTEANTGGTSIPTYVGAGTGAGGTGNVVPTLPTGWQQNDIFLLFVESNSPVNAPSGWTAVSGFPISGGSTAPTSLSVFWRRATSSESNPTVTGGSDHKWAIILAFRGCIQTGDPWDVTATGTNQIDNTVTALSANEVTTTVPNTLIVVAGAHSRDNARAHASDWTNPNLANPSITEAVDSGTTAGSGGGIFVAYGGKATAGATGATNLTYASNTVQTKLLGTIALKPQVNYQLDLEAQWVDAKYEQQNKELCIKTGTLNSENLKVDVWSGSSWITIINALTANSWNNVSVSTYLTSSTFTIRFIDTTTSNDTTQSSWQIDCVLLHTWSTLYTAEVEFTGASNTTLPWSQLSWTVDSCLNVSSVDVTLQLFNYTANQYPTSGDGYISYTSSATPNTDETKNQTITTNPENFRDSSGNWKIKVKCTKTSTQFDFKADLIKFEPSITEYKASTEFLFTDLPADTPAQLDITIVNHYNATDVEVTIQLWNYTSNSYVESGEGCLQYVSSSVNETKTLTITVGPESYTYNGEAKIKVTAVKTSASPFQQETNQVELCFHAFKYDYVLKIVNQVSDSWKIRLRAYGQTDIARLYNCTIYFHIFNGASSQIIIINGSYSQQQGDWYDLTGLSTACIAMTVSVSESGTSLVYTYLEVLFPDTTTYNLMDLTFEIS